MGHPRPVLRSAGMRRNGAVGTADWTQINADFIFGFGELRPGSPIQPVGRRSSSGMPCGRLGGGSNLATLVPHESPAATGSRTKTPAPSGTGGSAFSREGQNRGADARSPELRPHSDSAFTASGNGPADLNGSVEPRLTCSCSLGLLRVLRRRPSPMEPRRSKFRSGRRSGLVRNSGSGPGPRVPRRRAGH